MISPDRARFDFPVFATRTYLNSGSYGAMCVSVKAAIEQYIETRMTVGSDWDHWVEKREQARGLMAQLVGCAPDEMSVSTSVSESVNSLASALDFGGRRDGVVVTDFDFPTTSQIWLAQTRRGARVTRATADESGMSIPLAEFERLVDDRTLLVSVPVVCFRNGARLDLGPIIRLCHERGSRVLVDAYQAIGSFPIDVGQLDVDFLVGGCLKYLIGTAGIGFMYVRGGGEPGLQPSVTGWFAQEDIGRMDIYHHRPSPTARRFESGTPNVCGLYAVSAALRYLLDVGLDAADARIRMLTAEIARRTVERGWHLASPTDPDRHGATMAIRSTDAAVMVRRLEVAGIILSHRDGNLRVSNHFYNDLSDLDRLFEVLDRNAGLIARRDGGLST
ncbi:MAG: aminotransferase class V-fold PLP-dependent enzyme [Steroidobacteraceae bacterium]